MFFLDVWALWNSLVAVLVMAAGARAIDLNVQSTRMFTSICSSYGRTTLSRHGC